MVRMVSMQLPWPPSVNTYWRSVLLPTKQGKVLRVLLSNEGRKYREACAQSVLVQRIQRHALVGRLSVRIEAFPPDRRARDLDNLLKGLLDGLKTSGVIRDDADIDELSIARRCVVREGSIKLSIQEIDGEAFETRELFSESA